MTSNVAPTLLDRGLFIARPKVGVRCVVRHYAAPNTVRVGVQPGTTPD
jgi:hypothetical protein